MARNLRRDLGGRQHAAMAGLRALAHLHLDHLDLLARRDLGEQRREEAALRRAAAEIAGADLPDDVAAVLAVIGAEAALAGVVGEAAAPGALLSARIAFGLSAPKLIAEMLNTEHRRAWRIPGPDARRNGFRPDAARHDRMAHPFVALRVNVVLRAEGSLVEVHLGALIDQRALVAAERPAVLVAPRRNIAASPDAFLPAGNADAPRSDNCEAPRACAARDHARQWPRVRRRIESATRRARASRARRRRRGRRQGPER